MKNTLFLFVAAVGLTAPLLAHADPAPLTAVPNRPPHHARAATVVRAPGDTRATYHITTDTSTGSHIPMVIRRYDGRSEVLGGGFRTKSVYDAGAIGMTGATDVGTALRRLDPSIL